MKAMLAFCVLAASLASAAGPASAQAELMTTNPANGAMLAAAPERLKLTFSEPVRLSMLILRPQLSAEQALTGEPSGKFTRAKTVLLPPLPPDRYRVQWRAQSGSGHLSGGGFVFTVVRPVVAPPAK